MPHQVSVFLENKPGKLEKITTILADRGINIRAITLADSGDSGVLKLLVNDPGKACDILTEHGLAAALKEVVAMKVADRPGGLLTIAKTLTEHGINVDDAYGFVLRSGETGVFVVQVKDPSSAARILTAAGIELLDENDLYYL